MEENKIIGYKAFYLVGDKLVDKFDNVYEEKETYHYDGDVIFHRSGFHMCLNPEDTLRYLDAFENEVVICEVEGSGKSHEYWDDYNEYYDMYSVEDLTIIKQLSKKDLLDIIKNKTFMKKDRFIKGMPLANCEINYLLENIRYTTEGSFLTTAIEYNIERQNEVKKEKAKARVRK